MFQLQFYVPKGYMLTEGRIDKEFLTFCRSLEQVHDEWMPIPFTPFSIKLTMRDEGAFMGIRMQDELLYINCICLGADQFLHMFNFVEQCYDANGFGAPKRPTGVSWVHSIPFREHLLEDKDIWVCQKLTVAFFRILYEQRMQVVNMLN